MELTRKNRELIELLDSLLASEHETVKDLLSQTLTAHKIVMSGRNPEDPQHIGPFTEMIREMVSMGHRIRELEHKLDAQGRQTGGYWQPAPTTGGSIWTNGSDWTGGYVRKAVMAADVDDLGAFNLVDPDTGHTMTVKSK